METLLMYPITDCPVGCAYCFNAKSQNIKYDKNVMCDKLVELSKLWGGYPPQVIMHGGEVLTMPIRDFKFFIKHISDLNVRPVIQTSLFTLLPEHIRIFKKYKVGLGVSIDGPPELNILRGPREKKANQDYQKRLIKNMAILKKEGLEFGTISVLTKINAGPDKIDRLIEWGIENKIQGGRFNAMFTPSHNPELLSQELAPSELKNAFLKLADACYRHPTEFNPAIVREVQKNLLGQGLSSCNFTRCDYLFTRCSTILPDGGISRCDRCFELGFMYQPIESTLSRSEMLKQTECSGCKYFNICGGGCPSEGVGDFRHKTKYCEALYALFERVERQIRSLHSGIVLSIDIPNYFEDYYLKNQWLHPPQNQQNQQNQVCIQPNKENKIDKDGHGDWSDFQNVPHGDSCGGVGI